jgi:hypothetical protein
VKKKANPRLRLFRQLFPHESQTAYRKWIAQHTKAFCESRHVYSGEIPDDMHQEFTDWLRFQHMEAYEQCKS